ncbi:unnamed protein product [Phyllotreta striolata]|uniref:Uncharacterized protein n=1 Tax=Phyllotreta striolata TaxID=444603 RepID=A0A9N9TU18_PHYSR|nr:unnamed protein product [Phyllotreta striolata]
MDLNLLIFAALFVIASFSLFLIYKFGIKEKSYEEALAEQRLQTNALLGTKSKTKDKKSKKASKKIKEKAEKIEKDEVENSENKESAQPSKPHVEFKEETEEVPIKETLDIPLAKEVTKPKKNKKVRPILVNRREKSPVRPDLNTSIVNHFEENPPKDDFELLKTNNKEEVAKPKPIKEKKQVQEVSPPISGNKTKKNAKPVSADPPKSEPASVAPLPEGKVVIEVTPASPPLNGVVAVGNVGKEKKKKKSEFNTKQQLSAERDELINSVRKAELSKTEIQLLIDLLLNKQLEAPAVIDEWSEGKSDPIQKLKKQLSEKEKLLTEEQEALAGAQQKLREIRSEQQTEKLQLQQKIRSLEEIVQAKQIEIQATNNRFQVNAQKIQQLQTELNTEIMKARKLLDDNNQLQLQLKQYEVNNMSQLQEADGRLNTLRMEFEEITNQNQHLQQVIAEKDHHFMIQMNTIEKGYKDSHQETERRIEMLLRQEAEWKREIANLNSTKQKQFEEQRKLEHSLNQLNEQLRLINNEKSQLKSELQQAKEELYHLGHLSEGKNNQEVEILNLSNELSSTRNELSSRIEELQQTEKKYKTELESSNKKYSLAQKELEEQKTKNDELRKKNWKVMEALKAAENRDNKASTAITSDLDINRLKEELLSKQQESQKQFLQRLFPEIEELKSAKGADWQEKYAALISDFINSIREENKQISVTPVSSPPSTPQKSSEIAKLQSQLLHYKNIIDDTEGMLNKLQKHVEQEEMTWRSQLAAKEAELDSLKENRITQNAVDPPALDIQGVAFAYNCIEKSLPTIIDELQTKLVNVENSLSKEIEEKRKLVEECQLLKSQRGTQNGVDSTNSLATIEKLSEEVNSLREQLREEQTKNGDINGCLKAQNCNNSTNGPAFIEVRNIRNANICSNMGCQFLYCDDNSSCNNI